MNEVILDGNNLTLNDVENISINNYKVKISEVAMNRIHDGRKKIFDLVDNDVPVYGFNTGVGWNKDKKVFKEFFQNYNSNLIYAHSLGVGPHCSVEEGRSILLVRLNTFLVGCTGVAPEIVEMYKHMLNSDITPKIPRKGSVGQADITNLSHIGLAIMGEGEVYHRGEEIKASEAFEKTGAKPINLGPKDGLAIVSSNALSAGVGALLLKDIEKILDISDMIYALSLEGLDGNTSPLDRDLYDVRPYKGQKISLNNVRAHLKGSSIYEPNPDKPVQDPLCFRGSVQIHGAVRDSLKYTKDLFDIQLNSSEDNPCLLLEKDKLISCSNYEPISWILGFEMLGVAFSHLSKTSCYRTIKLSDPRFTKLNRFLSPNDDVICYGTIQKVFDSLNSEIRHLSNPSTSDFLSLAGDIEDHANNTPYVIDKLKKIVDNMYYILAIEYLHGAQALDLRDGNRLGVGSEKAYNLIREVVPFYDKDRPLYQDIEKVYTLLKSKKILTSLS